MECVGITLHIECVVSYIFLYSLQGNPDAASNLTVEFEEDQRSGFARHAILTLSWDSPSSKQLITGQLHLKSGVRIMLFSPTLDTDHLRVENYQLIIELNSINDDCMAQEPLNVTLNRVRNN